MKVYEILLILLFIVCLVVTSTIQLENLPDDLISVLYLKYKEALGNVSDVNEESLRRTIKHNKEYKVHVKKLKEVNGFKTHNLLIQKEVKEDPDNPIIYINNPVETRIPNAYLTLEEFKKVLTDRVNRQRLPLNTVNKQHKKYTNNVSGTVHNNTIKYKTVYVSNKMTNKATKSVTIKFKKPTDITNKKETENLKNITHLKLPTTFSISKQTKSSKVIITTINYVSKTLPTIGDNKDGKLKTTHKAAIRTNNVTVEVNPEYSVLNTILTPNDTIVTDSNYLTINDSTIAAKEDKNITNISTNVEEETVTEKEVSTTSVRKLTRSKLSRPLVFMGGFT